MKRKLIIILIIILVLVAGGFITINIIMSNHERQIDDISITDLDLNRIPDGTYIGKHYVFPIDVEVNVTVKNHKITNIELVKHQHGQGEEAEEMANRVLEAQSLMVDAVTGATSSSKVILKAIEKALAEANQ
jgi:uncharacterized protein with FMN-binding domain